jgi:hypothetical protein
MGRPWVRPDKITAQMRERVMKSGKSMWQMMIENALD